MCLSESIPSSKRDVYDEVINFIQDLSKELDALKKANDALVKEQVVLQKQLDAAQKKKKS
jgi:hypothetical protein